MQSIRKERFLSDNNVGYSIIPLVGTALCSLLFFNQIIKSSFKEAYVLVDLAL